jgi:hypothetical protein
MKLQKSIGHHSLTPRKHGKMWGSSLGLVFFIFILFFVTRGASPETSELSYAEYSPLGESGGSVVPASCNSAYPFGEPGAPPAIDGYPSNLWYSGDPQACSAAGICGWSHSGSHFRGDCTTPCPSGAGSYDPYYDPNRTGCPAATVNLRFR